MSSDVEAGRQRQECLYVHDLGLMNGVERHSRLRCIDTRRVLETGSSGSSGCIESGVSNFKSAQRDLRDSGQEL